MAKPDLRPGEKYYRAENYTMKCRLYMAEEQMRRVDEILHAMRIIHNVAMYEMWNYHINVRESVPDSQGNVVHFPDLQRVVKAEYINRILEEHEECRCVPKSALMGKNGLFLNDVQKQLHSQRREMPEGKGRRSGQGQGVRGGLRPIEYSHPHYYSDRHPRTSYTYQEAYSKFREGPNENVLYFDMMKVGLVKVRGWNRRLRFNPEGTQDFVEYVRQMPRDRKLTVTVSKDSCGDYWMNIRLFQVAYKPMRETPADSPALLRTGGDCLLAASDGTVYENRQDSAHVEEKVEQLCRKLSRQYGNANPGFRRDRKRYREETGEELMPSLGYQKTRRQKARLERRARRRRCDYANKVTTGIIAASSSIEIERGQMELPRAAGSPKDRFGGNAVAMLRYKSGWYGREWIEKRK